MPQSPAGCAVPGSGGSWQGLEGWHEDAVPSLPYTYHRSEQHRLWPMPVAAERHRDIELIYFVTNFMVKQTAPG